MKDLIIDMQEAGFTYMDDGTFYNIMDDGIMVAEVSLTSMGLLVEATDGIERTQLDYAKNVEEVIEIIERELV